MTEKSEISDLKAKISQNKLLRNKLYLYLTEFFSGIAVMAVELGASRLLAPYFSSSQIVWTIIIGTIMIALALGNIWGGRIADRDPDPGRLYMRLVVAAIWIACIPLVGKFEHGFGRIYHSRIMYARGAVGPVRPLYGRG